jgi:hypothetical protein
LIKVPKDKVGGADCKKRILIHDFSPLPSPVADLRMELQALHKMPDVSEKGTFVATPCGHIYSRK